MSSTTPYIFISPRMMGRVDRISSPGQRGVTSETVEGHHVIWAAMIPYIPALSITDQEAHTFGSDATSRIQWLFNRQIRFLYNLAQITSYQATFELRYVADPQPGSEALVRLVLLGKSFTTETHLARAIAQTQWERVSTLFPSEPPFRYPLIPVTEEDDPPDTSPWEATGFRHWFEPISDEELDSGQYNLIEIRKHEDWPTSPFFGKAHADLDYIPHPFVPPVDYTGMARLLEALARQTHKAFIGITIRPQRLIPCEEFQLTRFADWYTKAANGEVINTNPVAQIRAELWGHDDYDAYFRQRAELGKKVYETLARERQSLLLTNIRAVAFSSTLAALKEALGSEIIANSGTVYPCQYDVVTPHPGLESKWARYNMRWLELERWGIFSQLAQKAPELVRFRFFTTVMEAIAVFRLPTAPPDGRLPGVKVVDYPFNPMPPTDPSAQDDLIGLGWEIGNGGQPEREYRLPRSALARGMTFLGEDTTARAETIAALITYLAALRVPMIVLGPQETHTMRLALEQAHGRVIAPTQEAGGAERLAPPMGVQPLRWAAAIASALALAFDLPTHACQLLRLAITRTFVAAAIHPTEPWTASHSAPGLDEFLAALTSEVAQETDSGDAGKLLRDRCLPGLRELALIPGIQVFQELPPCDTPLFLHLPGVGVHHMSLLRAAIACASAVTALEQAASLAQPPGPKAVLLLIDPHYLLPQKRAGDQPLLPLIEGLRQAGGSPILVTGQPHLVDREVLAAAVFAAERLTQTDALTTSQHLMRLSDRQMRALADLVPGDMLWQRDGRTAQVRRPLPKRLSIQAPQAGGAG